MANIYNHAVLEGVALLFPTDVRNNVDEIRIF